MTKEQIIDNLKYQNEKLYGGQSEALTGAIKALEQQPSEDCVSRAEIKKIAKEMYLEVANMDLDVHTISDCIACTSSKCRQVLEDKLQALPPVTPTQKSNPTYIDCQKCENFRNPDYFKCKNCGKGENNNGSN